MNILYLDAIGGIAGDMFLSALLDGAKEEEEAMLLKKLADLNINGWRWHKEEVNRQGFRGSKIDFHAEKDTACRHLGDIVDIVKKADFDTDTEEKIIRTFDLIA